MVYFDNGNQFKKFIERVVKYSESVNILISYVACNDLVKV